MRTLPHLLLLPPRRHHLDACVSLRLTRCARSSMTDWQHSTDSPRFHFPHHSHSYQSSCNYIHPNAFPLIHPVPILHPNILSLSLSFFILHTPRGRPRVAATPLLSLAVYVCTSSGCTHLCCTCTREHDTATSTNEEVGESCATAAYTHGNAHADGVVADGEEEDAMRARLHHHAMVKDEERTARRKRGARVR